MVSLPMSKLNDDKNMFLDVEASEERIGKLIRDSGLFDRDIAEVMSISTQAVNRWRNRKTLPDIENLFTLSRILKTTVDDLLVSQGGMKSRRSFEGSPWLEKSKRGIQESHDCVLYSFSKNYALNDRHTFVCRLFYTIQLMVDC